jgi:oligoribonuclease (3'-5' exoribonuclease)
MPSSFGPTNAFFGMPHLNKNLLCAIDIITTGPSPDSDGLLEIAVLPLDHMLRSHKDFLMFNIKMKPECETSYQKAGMRKEDFTKCVLTGFDMYKAGDLFLDWVKSLQLKSGKQVVPLAFNWPQISAFLRKWLTDPIFDEVFSWRYRDVLSMANYLNDRADTISQNPFYVKQDFYYIANKHKVQSHTYRSSTNDVRVLSELFKEMLLNPPVVT